MFRVVLALFSLAVTVYSQSTSFGGCPTVVTQASVDINKYLGFWYEIARFPTNFEKGKCTRARYALKADGHIEVYNRGIENGVEFTATGDAFRPDDNEQGKLKVQFAEGTPYGNYWILNTDYDTFSLVYSCTSIAGIAHIEFAWILARNMTLDDTTTNALKNELASYKVDISKFIDSDQSECPP